LKNWASPGIVSLRGRIAEQAWTREKLLKVRDFVQGALELVEAGGGAPEVATQIRAILAEIDVQLAATDSGP
jgi:hypothetical protein